MDRDSWATPTSGTEPPDCAQIRSGEPIPPHPSSSPMDHGLRLGRKGALETVRHPYARGEIGQEGEPGEMLPGRAVDRRHVHAVSSRLEMSRVAPSRRDAARPGNPPKEEADRHGCRENRPSA